MTLASSLALALAVALQGVQSHEHRHPPSDAADPPAAPADQPAEADPAALRGFVLQVGPGGFATLADAVAASEPGDTLVIAPGVYRERVTIEHRLTLLGRPGTVLDGEGQGTVLTLVDAPGSRLEGLTIRGSGKSVNREDSGVMVERSPGLVVRGCRLEDVLFGVYLKQSRGAVVADNVVTGKELPVPNRGDGIRFWYSPGGLIESNDVQRIRDVVIWFSDSLTVRGNRIRDGRYGLHYMYSDHNRFENNRFSENLVGAFLMYSNHLVFSGNVFAESAGASGMGLGLKDTDAVRATNNVFVKNSVGIYLDNSPLSGGAGRNHFAGNVVAFNDVGVSLLPSVAHNHFTDNTFVDNLREVAVSGGGNALANRWEGNRWSRYAGFDDDGDGHGDTPFVLTRLSDRLISSNPELELFTLSPAAGALDVLARILPFLEPTPVVVDSTPRMVPARSTGVSPAVAGPSGGRAWVGLILLGATLVALRLSVRFRSLAFPFGRGAEAEADPEHYP